MAFSLEIFAAALLTGLGYATVGMLQAFASNEPFDATSFLKTTLVSLVSAGVISASTSDIALSIAGSGVLVVALDKGINTLRTLYNTGKLAPSSPSTSSTPTPPPTPTPTPSPTTATTPQPQPQKTS